MNLCKGVESSKALAMLPLNCSNATTLKWGSEQIEADRSRRQGPNQAQLLSSKLCLGVLRA